MASSSAQFHEDASALRRETREMHRAIVSLMEELEAIDWYAQRVDVCSDEELARVLAHNRREEIEHACMVLEWIRRHDERFDHYLRKLLFSSSPIDTEDDEEDRAPQQRAPSNGSSGSLGIGSLRAEEVAR